MNGCSAKDFRTYFNFVDYMSDMSKIIHDNAKSHGWWDDERNDGELIALCHSELSEMLEALREGSGKSEKIVGFSAIEEEAADVIIRLMDMAEKRGWKLGEAIVAKHEYNKSRPYRHGKRF